VIGNAFRVNVVEDVLYSVNDDDSKKMRVIAYRLQCAICDHRALRGTFSCLRIHDPDLWFDLEIFG